MLAIAEAGQLDAVEVLASHDLALPRLQTLAARDPLHLSIAFAGSAGALRRLNEGLCQLAGFHAPRLPEGSTVFAEALRPLLRPGEHMLIGSHSRRQGLMYAPGPAEAPTLRSVAAGADRFVNRQTGSGTRLLLDRLLRARPGSRRKASTATRSASSTRTWPSPPRWRRGWPTSAWAPRRRRACSALPSCHSSRRTTCSSA